MKRLQPPKLEATIINPDFVPALVDLGWVSAEKGDLPKAEKYLLRATTLEPHNAAALNNLAQVLSMEGRNAEADTALKRAQQEEAAEQAKQPKQPAQAKKPS